MQLRFLGTAAADFSPLLETTLKYTLDSNARRSSSLLLNGHVLIDCGPHVLNSMGIQGIDPMAITDLFVTHFHNDHYAPVQVAELACGRTTPLRIWHRADAMPPPILGAEFHPLQIGQSVRVGEFTVRALAANHTQTPLHYDFETPEAKLFYGCDGAWLLNDTFYAMRGREYDMMILDGTVGDYNGDFRMAEHNSIPMIRLMLASFRSEKVVTDRSIVCLSHLAPSLHKSHEETCRILAADGMTAAFDGMVLNLDRAAPQQVPKPQQAPQSQAPQLLLKTNATLVFAGLGYLTLTTNSLIWSKSPANFLAFGVFGTMTRDGLCIPFEMIQRIDNYTYVGGGGLVVVTRDGQTHKFSIGSRQDFDYIYSYLTGYLQSLWK